MINLTTTVHVKVTLGFKALMSIMRMLAWARLISYETAIKTVCDGSAKGIKYRMGNASWVNLGRAIEYEASHE